VHFSNSVIGLCRVPYDWELNAGSRVYDGQTVREAHKSCAQGNDC
jgi:hypothetical protein